MVALFTVIFLYKTSTDLIKESDSPPHLQKAQNQNKEDHLLYGQKTSNRPFTQYKDSESP